MEAEGGVLCTRIGLESTDGRHFIGPVSLGIGAAAVQVGVL